MRVISGMYRGRRLRGPAGRELRPTADRLKETLFDILGDSIRGAIFLDAFSGTGSIGIEALSRGAAEVTFIESDPKACRLIHSNLELCGIADSFLLLSLDVFKAVRSLALEGRSFDILFLDPPYRWKYYQDLLDTLFGRALVRPRGRAIVEHHQKADLPASRRPYELVRRVRQGDHGLSFYVNGKEWMPESVGIP